MWMITIKELARLFEELTGNEFESWEREKKIQKKHHSFPLSISYVPFKFVVPLGTLAALLSISVVKLCRIAPEWKLGMEALGLRQPVSAAAHYMKKFSCIYVQKVKTMKETGKAAEGVWSSCKDGSSLAIYKAFYLQGLCRSC
ncbi:hypothetical protein HAX54_018443 [Datura stramonium]|uniref:Uncharacterized protein n=1 Tax=Datura stramonium TaxID=4076 RepID=A0ABS8UP06_DATST|nr:hypothetical protein [Datura stramonium]